MRTALPAALAVLVAPTVAVAQPFSIDWYTIDGGGGTSSGGGFTLSGTIGQPDAGVLSGGGFTLTGGFWAIAGAQDGPCSAVDFAEPFGVVDISDVDAFIDAFLVADPLADLAPPFGIVDITDIDTFIPLFLAGCP